MREETKESMVAYNGPIVCCHKSAEEKKLEIYMRKRWRTVTIRKDVEFVKAVLYY